MPPSLIGEGNESLLHEPDTELLNSSRYDSFNKTIQLTLTVLNEKRDIQFEILIYRVIVKSEPADLKPIDRSPNVVQENESPAINVIKIETNDASDDEENDKCVEIVETNSTHTVQPYQIGTETSLARATLLSGSATALNASPPANDNKYCNVCDIKFKYLNSYIAHKESYCRNISNDLDIGAVASNPATSVIATTCSSPNQTSVVT